MHNQTQTAFGQNGFSLWDMAARIMVHSIQRDITESITPTTKYKPGSRSEERVERVRGKGGCHTKTKINYQGMTRVHPLIGNICLPGILQLPCRSPQGDA